MLKKIILQLVCRKMLLCLDYWNRCSSWAIFT